MFPFRKQSTMDPKEKERRERSLDDEEKNDSYEETQMDRPEQPTNNDSTAWLRASARPVPQPGRAEADREPG